MKEIILDIKDLFGFFESKGYQFPMDEIVIINEKIYLPDEKNEWKLASGFIKKEDTTIEFTIQNKNNYINIEVANLHKFVDENLNEIYAKDCCISQPLANDNRIIDRKDLGLKTDVYGVQIESPKHLYQDANGIVHHNTYSIRKVVDETPSELVKKYYKGNIGKSLTSCCAFFYKYSNGYFLLLDDNDAMIMKQGTSQQIKLFFKGLLDPDPGPIAVPTTVLKGASKGLEAYEQEEANNNGEGPKRRKRAGEKQKESVLISIDKELLREGIFRMSANDKIVVEEEVPLHESMDLYYHLRDKPAGIDKTRKEVLQNIFNWRKIQEARYRDDDDDDDDDYIDGDDPAPRPRNKNREISLDDFDPNVDEGDPNEMPTSFIFDSSVVFISNLTREEIDPAVFDRFTTVRVELNPLEFMNKLEKVLPNLGNLDPTITKVDPGQFLWAKKVVFVLMKAVTEAWALDQELMGVKIDIRKRSFTFRLVAELANDLLRLGRNEIRKHNLKGTLSDSKIRENILCKVEKQVLTKLIRKVVFGE